MTTLHAKRVLPYAVQDLFNLIATVKDYSTFLPGCQKVVIHELSDTSFQAELQIGYKFWKESFTSVITLTPQSRIEIQYINGPFKHLHHYWAFKPVTDQETEVEFFIDFAFQSKIFQKAMDSIFAHSSTIIVEAFEKHLKKILKERNKSK